MQSWYLVNNKQLFFVWLLFAMTTLVGRHPFRLPNPSIPQVTAQWADGSHSFTITNRNIRYYPMFAFDITHFIPYLLPHDAISFRSDPKQSVDGTLLATLIQDGMEEILHIKKKRKRKKVLQHFFLLQDKNFNYKRSCGLVVLAFKDYPFVVKLFIEQPTTILDFHATGIEPTFFFYMGGGSNRHLSGFTRLTNREFVAKRIEQFPAWKNHVELPRKWFWIPHEQKNIVITGKNIGGLPFIKTEIPSVYAIIADKIDFSQPTKTLSSTQKGDIIMQLCNDLELNIDPHAKNFAFTEDLVKNKFKISLVDTEHFPTMVGPIKQKQFKTHHQWYLYLAGKGFQDIYLTSKRGALEAGIASVQMYYHGVGRPTHVML
jgi:hypothetical protein